MQFSLITLASIFAVAVSAHPTNSDDYVPCPDFPYSVPQCCSTDVGGVVDFDCGSPSPYPSSATEFRDVCALGGQRARCCTVPVLGQAVLCVTPVGV